MAYQYQWLLPKRVIFCHVSGIQGVEEIKRSMAELTSLLDQGEFPTHYVADVRDLRGIPTTNIREFQQLVSFISHPNLGWTVTIGINVPLINYIFSFVARVTRIRYRAVHSPQEALTFLKHVDSTVNLDVNLDHVIAAMHGEPVTN